MYFPGENSQLDDLYTRYRQRLRKSLFVSGLWICVISCLVSIIFCAIGSQVQQLQFHLPFEFVVEIKLISLTASFELQNISDIVQLAFMCFVLVGILVALQFPAVLYTPWAALAFSIAATGTVGTISTVVGGPVAPLPLFALILVN